MRYIKFKNNIVITLMLMLLLLLSAYLPANGAYGGIDMPSPVSSPVNAGYLYAEVDSSINSYGHMGLDFAAPSSTSVYATFGGKVVTKADLGNTSYGKYLIIESTHPLYPTTKFYHLYAHLSDYSQVTLNQTVTKGQLIAKSGNSGGVGAHLHYETRMGSNSWYSQRNPEGLLKRSTSDGYGAVRGKVLTSTGAWARKIRVAGATKGTDTNYGASYSYHLMANNSAFPDEAAYGINYYIARVRTGTVTLNYNYSARTQSVSIPANGEVLASNVTLP